MSDAETKKRKDPYRDTLHLPKTSFSMKANLLEIEPRFQKYWEDLGLYSKMASEKGSKGKFLLHDGPPYANGPIHLGHLLNKTLKDLVVRSKKMAGYEVEFIPGWDCHGLPIEHKVLKELGDKAKGMEPIKIRNKCRSYAQKFVKLQTKQMKRLGTLGDYDHPYLTMTPDYEAGVLEVFADLVSKGLVYRDLKPVHWSIENQTALADAELEYYDKTDSSIYVLFNIQDSSKLPKSLNAPTGEPVNLMIWTTTPWTLPANLAVAVSPSGNYCLYSYTSEGKTNYAIVVENLAEKLFTNKVEDLKLIGTCTGRELADSEIKYAHPFIERTGKVVTAEYVTFEDGTGLVHTAPGHGIEDYQTGLKEGLDIYCPVSADGTFDDTVPDWLQGENVWKANSKIIEYIREKGALFHEERYVHSYPHDWRSKTPTIFRATEQWFIAVDKIVPETGKTLRDLGLEYVENETKFVPDWGRNRMRGMLESRPDWCISRQRIWGLPIPSFVNADGEVLMTTESVKAVTEKIREKGSNYWFIAEPEEILSSYDPERDPDAPAWLKKGKSAEIKKLHKGLDIFDVWFESGSSWNSVLKQRNLGFPADLYIEGTDQHRGWFQLSLLPSLGAAGRPPFNSILTHGFIVDSDGKKMSKSGGNAIDVDELVKQYGADVCRWWVSSLNYANDVKVDWGFFKIASEEYRKVRNTIRFMLGNLSDFNSETDSVELTNEDKYTIDAWALSKTDEMIESVKSSYEEYNYKRVNELIFNFCNETLSAVYIAAVKDRLYCGLQDSRKRRRTQTTLFFITESLIKLLAPVLVHTAEDAYQCLLQQYEEHNNEPKKTSVHLTLFPQAMDVPRGENWEDVMTLRNKVLKALEEAKMNENILNPLDAGVDAYIPKDSAEELSPYLAELADLCGVSRFAIQEGEERIVIDDLTAEPRCERSWKRDGTVKLRSDGGMLSDRDAEAAGVL